MQNYSLERWRCLSPSFCFRHEKLIVTQRSPCHLYRCSFLTEKYNCKQQLCSEFLSFKTFLGRSPPRQRPFPSGKPKLRKVRDPFAVWQETEYLPSWRLWLQIRFLQHLHLQENVRSQEIIKNVIFLFWEFLETLFPSSFSPQWLLEKAAGYWTWTKAIWVTKIPF